MSFISVFTDGGARGNPGPAALGVYIEGEGKALASIGKYIGEATNNVAEYSAVVEALSWINENREKHEIEKVNFYTDSLLAYSQIIGVYKVKNAKIREFILKIRELEQLIKIPIFYHHIPREKNKLADLMVNKALDER